jgi:hypothetical protein
MNTITTWGHNQGGFATRTLENATRTGLPSWLWARGCGARDGLAGLPRLEDDTSDSPSPQRSALTPPELMTEFLRGRVQRYVERDEREFNAALSAVDVDVEALRSLADEIARAESVRASLADTLEHVVAGPRVTAADIVRGPAEQTTHETVLIARRQRARDAIVKSARGDVTAADKTLGTLRHRYADHVYRVQLAFDHYVTRSGQARAQTERLCAEYRRQVTRHHPAGDALQSAWADTVSVPAPARTSEPCPWIPAHVPTPTTAASPKEN